MNIKSTSVTIDGTTAWLVVECPPDSAPARWEQADKQCDTCNGTGRNIKPSTCELVVCPGCHGSKRHTFTLDVECEWCVGYGYLLGSPDHYEAGSDAVFPCTDDAGEECNDGTRQLSVHVVEVLPIHDHCADYKPADHICRAWQDERWYWHRSSRWVTTEKIVTLPADAAPGMWAVRLAVHT
jgi:hypothetical protein